MKPNRSKHISDVKLKQYKRSPTISEINSSLIDSKANKTSKYPQSMK